jgi:hypothetical protein
MSETPTRKGSLPIKVWVLPEEKALIEAQAKACALSTSAYLRNVGLGFQVKGVLDQQAVIELAKVNGDLGRLGGLLKLWLTNDEKLSIYDRVQLNQTILGVLDQIQDLQAVLLEKVKRI